MSKSYRDDLWYRNKHHHEVCTRHATRWPWAEGWCECDEWLNWRHYDYPVPSWWNKDIRRAERAFTRNKMQRAKAGSIDWSGVDERRSDEWFW